MDLTDAEPPPEPASPSPEPAVGRRSRGLSEQDRAQDPRFDRIARLAAMVFDAQGAAVALIDGEQLWLKAAVGQDTGPLPRAESLAALALVHAAPIFCADIRKDPIFAARAPEQAQAVRFYAAAPLTSPTGEVIGVLTVADPKVRKQPDARQQASLIDLAALATEELIRDAEAAASRLRHAFDLERLNLALSAASMGAYEWNRKTNTILLSERLQQMASSPTERVPADWGGGMGGMLHPDDHDKVLAAVDEGLREEGRYSLEHRLLRASDGETFWVSSTGIAIEGAAADAGLVIGVIQDITPRKMAEEQRETLVAELDHRIKNVLSAVQSVASQSARQATSLESFLKTFAGRLKSMAAAHQLLTATRWRGANMRNVAAAELGGIAPGQTRWEGPEILLTPRAANAMSLALHELATNAVKFGALSVEHGRVDVRWRSLADGGMELSWAESGGPTVSPPTRRGFGATLLDKVTGRELGGSVVIDHRREGVTAILRTGASAIATSASAPPEAQGAGEAADAPAAPPTPQPYVVRPARIDGLRLLIVEDALLLALELEAGLQEAGAIMVGSASDVEEAMGMVDLKIDAAVLDANLNGHSVLPVAEALAARGVPFVFATGYGDNRFNPGGFDAPVIRKPYDVTQVTAALAEITGRV